MSDLNELEAIKNLQATNRIISIMEKSKEFIEDWVDRSPECLIVFERSGRVVKANKLALDLLETNERDYLEESVFKLLDDATANIIKTSMSALEQRNDESHLELEIRLRNSKNYHIYNCSLSLLKSQKNNRFPLFTFSGRDLTKLRSYENALSEIYNNIPLGIVIIDKNGLIKAPYSKYCEYLLSSHKTNHSLENMNYFDMIFVPSQNYLSAQDIITSKMIMQCIGKPKITFDAIAQYLPRSIKRNFDGKMGNLTLTYYPIVRSNATVDELMIIMEDREILNRLYHKYSDSDDRFVTKLLADLLNSKLDDKKIIYIDLAKHLDKIDNSISRLNIDELKNAIDCTWEYMTNMTLTKSSQFVFEIAKELKSLDSFESFLKMPVLFAKVIGIRADIKIMDDIVSELNQS